MRTKAFMFMGVCNGCGRDREIPRAGVDVGLTRDDDVEEWLCLSCARRLARKLAAAVLECEKKIASGLEYRFDRWRLSRTARAVKRGATS